MIQVLSIIHLHLKIYTFTLKFTFIISFVDVEVSNEDIYTEKKAQFHSQFWGHICLESLQWLQV